MELYLVCNKRRFPSRLNWLQTDFGNSIVTGNNKTGTFLGPSSSGLDVTYTPSGVNYTYSVEWVTGCTTSVKEQSVYFPSGSTEETASAQSILDDCYSQCEYIQTDRMSSSCID